MKDRTCGLEIRIRKMIDIISVRYQFLSFFLHKLRNTAQLVQVQNLLYTSLHLCSKNMQITLMLDGTEPNANEAASEDSSPTALVQKDGSLAAVACSEPH